MLFPVVMSKSKHVYDGHSLLSKSDCNLGLVFYCVDGFMALLTNKGKRIKSIFESLVFLGHAASQKNYEPPESPYQKGDAAQRKV